MGSNCCKNVRVAGISQPEPDKINNADVQQKPAVVSVPVPSSFELDINKTPAKFDSSVSLQHQRPPESDSNDRTSRSFRIHETLNEISPVDDRKTFVSSQLPPIRRKKHTLENEQRQQQQYSHLERIVPRSTNEEFLERLENLRLPPLSKLTDGDNDDNLVESVSDGFGIEIDEKNPDDWRLLTVPDSADFCAQDRFFTSTPIPPSPEQSISNDEHVDSLNRFIRPKSNNIGSDDEFLSAPSSVVQALRLREHLNTIAELSPKHPISFIDKTNLPMITFTDGHNGCSPDNSFDESTIYLSNTSFVTTERKFVTNDIDVIDPETFVEAFNLKRQHVIDNSSYRSIIEAWRPNTIEQLVDQVKIFSKNKPTLDRLWILFYWIVRNIEYDTVPYVGRKHIDKSAEAVFRTGKAVADGYVNLFQHLCSALNLKCEKVNGYSKVYVFDPCNTSSVPIDHTWNAVEINQHWYLIDLTLSAGYLDENRVFRRDLNSYYFLPRPNEMIYHHFPTNERWQLLKTPIKMAQYMQMPKLWPTFFQLNLKLISPNNIKHVDLVSRQPYAIVLIQAPRNVSVVASFLLNEKEVDGGNRVVFDGKKRLYRCYFAPASAGTHIIRIVAKDEINGNGLYSNVAEFELDIRQLPAKRISFPKTWKSFYELNLHIVWPCNTHLIKMNHGDTHTEILIRAPSDVEVTGQLTVDNSIRIAGGNCTFLDRRKGVWRCMFAPHRNGLFEAYILAKRRLDPGGFAIAVQFKIKARRIPTPPLSYPTTWQLFHDLDLEVEVPRNSATVTWPDYGSYAQICIRTPDDVQLMSCIEYNSNRVEDGSLTQYNSEKQHWQLFFAPERTGKHKLLVFAHCSTPDGVVSGIAAEFYLDVPQLRHSIKFPIIYTTFLTKRCRIFEPLDGILKKGAIVCIHCEIPNARQVDLTIDSKWVKSEGYNNPILKRQIVVGSREVIIYAKYDENTIYSELIKYTVE